MNPTPSDGRQASVGINTRCIGACSIAHFDMDHPLAGFAEQLRLSHRAVAVRYFGSKVLHHLKHIDEAEMVLFCCFLAKSGRQAFGPCTIPQFIDLHPHRDEPTSTF
jgi:hypothetical protein